MRYIIQAGSLYQRNPDQPVKKLAYLKSPFYTVKKTIMSPEGKPCFFTDIKQEKTYVLMDQNGHAILTGVPGFEKHNGNSKTHQPLSHAPRMDHVIISLNPGKNHLTLMMLNSQNYRLTDSKNLMAAEILHNGIAGGWTIETRKDFSPYILMGLFIFCRYLDKENEFLVV